MIGNRWVLAAVTACTCMVAIDTTILPVSLPTIQREMAISFMQQQWIVNAYNLSLVALVIEGARMGERLGYRSTFIAGLILFVLASALCGLSETGWWFIVNRFIQGIGGALLIPSMDKILGYTFPPPERSRAIALNVSAAALCLIIGPCVGGALTQFVSWRFIFWMNVPIAFFALACARFVPTLPRKQVPLQVLEFFAFSLGCMGLVIGLMEGRNLGWDSAATWSLLTCGILSLFLFFLHMRTQEYPFLQISFLKNLQLAASVGSTFFLALIMVVVLFWTLYFQNVLHYPPITAGIVTAFAILPIIILSPLAVVILKKATLKIPVAFGFFILAATLCWLALHPLPAKLSTLFYLAAVFGVGLSFILAPCAIVAANEIPEEDRSKLSSLGSTLRQFATALGLAAQAVLFVHIRENGFQGLMRSNPETADLPVPEFYGLLENSPISKTALSQLPANVAKIVTDDSIHSYISGFISVNLFAALLCLLGAVFALILFKKMPYNN